MSAKIQSGVRINTYLNKSMVGTDSDEMEREQRPSPNIRNAVKTWKVAPVTCDFHYLACFNLPCLDSLAPVSWKTECVLG